MNYTVFVLYLWLHLWHCMADTDFFMAIDRVDAKIPMHLKCGFILNVTLCRL